MPTLTTTTALYLNSQENGFVTRLHMIPHVYSFPGTHIHVITSIGYKNNITRDPTVSIAVGSCVYMQQQCCNKVSQQYEYHFKSVSPTMIFLYTIIANNFKAGSLLEASDKPLQYQGGHYSDLGWSVKGVLYSLNRTFHSETSNRLQPPHFTATTLYIATFDKINVLFPAKIFHGA